MITKKSIRLILLTAFIFLFTACDDTSKNESKEELKEQSISTSKFVTVANGELMLEGKPYYYMGANYWQGMNLGMAVRGDRARLITELDQLKEMGVTNLRVLASSEGDSNQIFQVQPAMQTAPGVYDQEVLEGLDFFLAEMSKREMKAVMVLNNFWTWSGGMPQYLLWCDHVEVPYPQISGDWNKFTDYSKQFFAHKKANKLFQEHLIFLIGRKNTVSVIEYVNDPTIMAWQISNEPRGYSEVEDFRNWIDQTTQFIKKLAPRQLVSLGTEGNSPSEHAGINVSVDNAFEAVDYVTIHIWAQNWNWYRPEEPEASFPEALIKAKKYLKDHVAAAKVLGKPSVLEEFGIARDNNDYNPAATTKWRDEYYKALFNEVGQLIKDGQPIYGINFWSYSGIGRPHVPKGYWKKGDDFIGDPPHEPQGWYGVYDKDSTTIEIIKNGIHKNRP